MTTEALRKACEDGSFCHDMAIDIATERDLLYLACKRLLRALGNLRSGKQVYPEYLDSVNALKIAVLNSEVEMESN